MILGYAYDGSSAMLYFRQNSASTLVQQLPCLQISSLSCEYFLAIHSSHYTFLSKCMIHIKLLQFVQGVEKPTEQTRF